MKQKEGNWDKVPCIKGVAKPMIENVPFSVEFKELFTVKNFL